MAFVKGERVLSFHDELLYEAKILTVKEKKNETLYHIHYVGWSKSWDTWVSETDILKKNKENTQKMENLLAECKEAEKIEKSKNSRSRKRKLSISLADEEESGKELPFELPQNIVEILKQDKSLVEAGCSSKCNVGPSIAEFMNAFRTSESKTLDDFETSKMEEFEKGILAYFDVVYGNFLLYPSEKDFNCSTIRSPRNHCSVIHFIRFLSKLPDFLKDLLRNPAHVQMLKDPIQSLLLWTSKRIDESKLLLEINQYFTNPSTARAAE
ncbi:Oidioi.mRNA.OKI2018_I69.chr2.g5214.t1.cds [Oikopleura dioica]|uniref:Oidioi.mRNA.OKI2018_I69.chr2.g5214.t1.cds n=1 Tax=Oikopleura dioica TaxID=34765 RepID=A0ABN7T417_OIKDI|nr:Oidioi.mRNA.OKI2018_I69.chr2.g5214.t1.cds [Oikopleura dioica]